ncbi:GntR family transcriptional regulator [Streptomyces cinnabarinus]|uniref:GntR family transcriptional regulator n=1 Tax=Streptomyces cinnabarinus TaxID=67287 RepID=A0ABY7KMX8_9ACTN|nr:GntR family transcriptional regulator [Streptomyces cinnabarinus]WAZ25922.1 GntR family transcriptional regulator [Streptomyces cinnabarinus]
MEKNRIVETLLSRMADGTLTVGDRLPTQRDLAREFEVSRDTVQRALRELADLGYIEARQGSGTRVVRPLVAHEQSAGTRQRPMRLASRLSTAFEQYVVTLDVFALTGESLDPHLRLNAERVREGHIQPESISVRMLLPRIDEQFRLLTPVGGTPDPRPLDRLRRIKELHTASIKHTLHELHTERMVQNVSFECREIPVVPMQKLYLVNGSEVITGFYQVIERPVLLDTGEQLQVHDVLGLGATLHHHSATGDGEHPDPHSVAVVARAQRWYEHMWSNADPS